MYQKTLDLVGYWSGKEADEDSQVIWTLGRVWTVCQGASCKIEEDMACERGVEPIGTMRVMH